VALFVGRTLLFFKE